MEKTVEIIEELTSVMQREIELLGKYASIGDKIMRNLMDKDWENLQVHLTLSKTLSQSIEDTEAERDNLYRELVSESGVPESANFYQVVSTIDPDQRRVLVEKFRDLKLILLQAQGISWRIETYVASASGTMKELLNRMFPHRKGALYSRHGIIREADNNPMVVNKKL